MEMNKDTIVGFLYEHLNGFLSTVDEDGHPRVRAMQFMLEENGKLYFATSKAKNVYQELLQTPYTEFAISSPDFSKNLRISGPVKFPTESDLSASEKILNSYDFLKQLYQTPHDPIFGVFYIDDCTANYWDYENKQPQIFKL